MQIRIPKFQHGLLLKPPLVHQQAIHHTRAMIRSTRLLRSFDNLVCNDPRMGLCDMTFFELAGHAFLD
jgi:hypothetical protein